MDFALKRTGDSLSGGESNGAAAGNGDSFISMSSREAGGARGSCARCQEGAVSSETGGARYGFGWGAARGRRRRHAAVNGVREGENGGKGEREMEVMADL